MSKFGVMVMGPAGAGKSTFCASLITHLQLNRRSYFYVNLDPAAESFEHQPDLDIKDLISLEDVMDELKLGPNGGLIYCFEFLMENLNFLEEALNSLTEEYLIIFDMPGQIELYTHVPILPTLVHFLRQPGNLDIRLCAAYLLEATFVVDKAKYFAGSLSAMSAMYMLGLPHLNILSKMDLVKDAMRKKDFKKFIVPDTSLLDDDPAEIAARKAGIDIEPQNSSDDPKDKEAVISGAVFKRLNAAVAELLERFSMVQYLKLDCTDEDSLSGILSYIDDAIQWAEAQEPKEIPDEEFDEPEE
ncbi:GPN-loop GTPase [Podospora australis]|uniref:GPN-loop GTPase 3 n=1 Tax=Podospora australis TaxID=1536484 RepID=A0AAN6WXX8_9PEZI|nr:GPN-loop GTPase [Podospora australis]